jgi:uncharacterized protein (TIGR02391 family)
MAHPLLEAFPEPKHLLVAQPEELASVLMEVLPGMMQQAGVTFASVEQIFYPPHTAGYPQSDRYEVNIAIGEALAWLEREGLLIRNPTQSNALWYVLTRLGRGIKTRGELDAYRRGRELPTELLQPQLAEKVHHLFLRGDYDTAVFQAFKLVEISVREAAKYPPDWPAQKVMRSAFNQDGALTDKELPGSEQQAMSDLFAGAMGHAKNPSSHRDVKLRRLDTVRLILFASYLLELAQVRALLG